MTMTMKTSELAGAALDWAVAKCAGITWEQGDLDAGEYGPGFKPSTDWAQGGPIIEREGVTVSKEKGCWSVYFRDNLFEDDGSEHWQTGPTPLIAAMRCFVASKLGDEVEVPEELNAAIDAGRA